MMASWRKRRGAVSAKHNPRRRRPILEELESRTLLSAGDSFANAISITLAPDSSGSQTGGYQTSFETDYYKFVAPATTSEVIQQNASSFSLNTTVTTVFDANQNQIAFG